MRAGEGVVVDFVHKVFFAMVGGIVINKSVVFQVVESVFYDFYCSGIGSPVPGHALGACDGEGSVVVEAGRGCLAVDEVVGAVGAHFGLEHVPALCCLVEVAHVVGHGHLKHARLVAVAKGGAQCRGRGRAVARHQFEPCAAFEGFCKDLLDCAGQEDAFQVGALLKAK